MDVVRHPDAHAFAAAAGDFLAADPVRHTVPLSVLDGIVRGGQPAALLLTGHVDGRVVAAALRSPGHPLILAAVPAAYAADLARAVPEVDAVNGPVDTVTAFVGNDVHIGRRTRLFALDRLVPPTGVRGRARPAGADDLDVLGRWREAFGLDIDDRFADPRAHAEQSLRLGGVELIWEVDGVPVSQASAKPVVAGSSRIGPVYTPPEHRGHGYASAVTAAATRWALDAGAAHVVLYTDLANETTNRIYPRIGYRPVQEEATAVTDTSVSVPRRTTVDTSPARRTDRVGDSRTTSPGKAAPGAAPPRP